MIAKKSEFAQKLLDDLRTRKEKMAASTRQQTSGQSYSSMAAQDARSQPIKGQRSARVNVACKTGSSKMDGMRRRSSSHSGSFGVENSSDQLVPFSQGHNGNEMGDVSTAFDFVFKSGHKLVMDSSVSKSMLSFLQQISHGSVIDFRNSERKGNIKISTFHINEISKGAKKLSSILAASSEGLNPGRYSIEIGTDLFKSAKDLEESLRMLLSLHEAANNMNTQQKSKIRLLEGSEEDKDENDTRLDMQIDRPRFSFDKQSNSNKQEASNSIRQRSVALAYLTNSQLPNADNSLSMVSTASQKQSYSQSGEFSGKTEASEKRKETSFKVTTSSKLEKKVLPNIIAKLMGLEELTQHSESKNEMCKESESKQDCKVKLTTPHSTNSHLKNKGAEFSQEKEANTRLLQAERIPIFMGASSDIHEKKRQSSGSLSFQNGNQGRNRLHKEIVNAEEKRLCMPENNFSRFTNHEIVKKGTQERRRNLANDRNRKSSTQGDSKTNQKVTNALPAKVMQKESKFETEIGNSNIRVGQYQQKTQTAFGLSNRKPFGQPEITDKRLKPDRKGEKWGIDKFHKKDQEGSESVRIPIKKDPQQNHETQKNNTRKSVNASAEVHSVITIDCNKLDDDVIFTSNKKIAQESDHNITSTDYGVGAESKMLNSAPPLKEDKFIQAKKSMIKVPESDVQKINSIKTVDQVMNRHKDLPQRFNGPRENQSILLQETEFQHSGKRYSKYLDVDGSKSGTQQLQTTMQPPLNQVVNLSALQKDNLTDNTHGIPSQGSSYEHAPLCRIMNTGEPRACIIKSKEAGRVDQLSADIPDGLQAMAQKTSETKRSDPLNEEETQLKCILVLSQDFLNTAEALFKLNIPVNILQADNQECGDTKNKHLLESVYEIMKRKARLQMLKVHPFTKSSISHPKSGSLNVLVKQLYKDLEMLKCYGGVWGEDTGAYLLKMVERDMHCTDPDINCMWEYSWNRSSFASLEKDEIVKDVEKSIVDDLMNDILQDM